jgi:hypothetical protein
MTLRKWSWLNFRYYFFVCVTVLKFLPVVLYGCETWSLILSEKHRLRVFENKVLRRMFEPERRGNREVEKTT